MHQKGFRLITTLSAKKASASGNESSPDPLICLYFSTIEQYPHTKYVISIFSWMLAIEHGLKLLCHLFQMFASNMQKRMVLNFDFAPSTRASPSILGRFAPSIRASPSTFDWKTWFSPPPKINSWIGPWGRGSSSSLPRHLPPFILGLCPPFGLRPNSQALRTFDSGLALDSRVKHYSWKKAKKGYQLLLFILQTGFKNAQFSFRNSKDFPLRGGGHPLPGTPPSCRTINNSHKWVRFR